MGNINLEKQVTAIEVDMDADVRRVSAALAKWCQANPERAPGVYAQLLAHIPTDMLAAVIASRDKLEGKPY